MTNFSVTPSSPVSAKQENYTLDNGTLDSDNSSWCYATDVELAVISTFICVPCIFGLLGNATVIWLLGFCMKRNPFTTYILNLAVADFGVLVSLIPITASLVLYSNCIMPFVLPTLVGIVLFCFMFSMSQFLLTIISVDRCVSVLFPIWYRCHRPENLSTILCALIWIFCFLVHGIGGTLDIFGMFEKPCIILTVSLVDAVVCLPFISISSLILVIRFCFKTQQRRRGKLLMAILLALSFFLLFAFPLNVMNLVALLPLTSHDDFYGISIHDISVAYLCASVNSFVNPLIYFLVGIKKGGLCKENVKLILQRVFKQEEEVCGEELTSVSMTAQNCIGPSPN